MGNSKEGILHRLQRSKGFNQGGSKDSVTNYFPIGTRLVRYGNNHTKNFYSYLSYNTPIFEYPISRLIELL